MLAISTLDLKHILDQSRSMTISMFYRRSIVIYRNEPLTQVYVLHRSSHDMAALKPFLERRDNAFRNQNAKLD